MARPCQRVAILCAAASYVLFSAKLRLSILHLPISVLVAGLSGPAPTLGYPGALRCAVLWQERHSLLNTPLPTHSRSPSFSPKEPLLSLLLERPQKNRCIHTHPLLPGAVVYVQYTMLAPGPSSLSPPQKICMSGSQILCYLSSLIAVLRLYFLADAKDRERGSRSRSPSLPCFSSFS